MFIPYKALYWEPHICYYLIHAKGYEVNQCYHLISQIKDRLPHREVRKPAQVLSANQWQSQGWNGRRLNPKVSIVSIKPRRFRAPSARSYFDGL